MKRLFAALAMMLAVGGAALADDWAICSGPPEKGDLEQIIRDCTNIIVAGRKSREDLAIAYANRAIAYAYRFGHRPDYDRALADFDKAIQLKPDYADAYNNRGEAYLDKGDKERAFADFDKAIQLKPDYADAYNNRGKAYFYKGD